MPSKLRQKRRSSEPPRAGHRECAGVCQSRERESHPAGHAPAARVAAAARRAARAAKEGSGICQTDSSSSGPASSSGRANSLVPIAGDPFNGACDDQRAGDVGQAKAYIRRTVALFLATLAETDPGASAWQPGPDVQAGRHLEESARCRGRCVHHPIHGIGAARMDFDPEDVTLDLSRSLQGQVRGFNLRVAAFQRKVLGPGRTSHGLGAIGMSDVSRCVFTAR